MHVPRGQHIQRQRNPPQALLVPRASGVVGSAANADMRDVRSAGMCCVYRGDIPVDGAGRSVLYRPECRERRLVLRVADGLHAYGDRLRIPVGVIRFQ